jgi:hypothetical protein
MVVGARNPEGVSCAQRISCHSVFSIPAFHPLTTRVFVPNPISASLLVQHKYTIEQLYLLRLLYYLLYNCKVRL